MQTLPLAVIIYNDTYNIKWYTISEQESVVVIWISHIKHQQRLTAYSIYTHFEKKTAHTSRRPLLQQGVFVAYSRRLTISSCSNTQIMSLITACLRDPALSQVQPETRTLSRMWCFLVQLQCDFIFLHVRLTKASLTKNSPRQSFLLRGVWMLNPIRTVLVSPGGLKEIISGHSEQLCYYPGCQGWVTQTRHWIVFLILPLYRSGKQSSHIDWLIIWAVSHGWFEKQSQIIKPLEICVTMKITTKLTLQISTDSGVEISDGVAAQHKILDLFELFMYMSDRLSFVKMQSASHIHLQTSSKASKGL